MAPQTVSIPQAFVQWKNIEGMCLDFQCVCFEPGSAYEFHLDSDDFIFGRFKCPRCERVWQLTCPVPVEVDEAIGNEPLLEYGA